MTIRKLFTAAAVPLMLIAVSVSLLAAPAARKSATAELKDAKGHKVGDARLTETKGGVLLTVTVTHLGPGERAIHIHEAGRCEAPGFTTAGGHFNPEKKKHGVHNPEGHHAGDLPNLKVGADGKAAYKATVTGVTLSGDGANSLFHAGGTSVVIHEAADDNKTDPSGNAGARVACGVIQ